MRKLVILCALTALAVAAMSGAASAALVKATAPVQFHNENCGRNTEGKKIGTSVFKRLGNTVEVTYKLTKGLPGDHYEISLWNATGGACQDLGTIASLTTNKKGEGTAKGTIAVPAGDEMFFSTGLDKFEGFYNDSLTVLLP
jgi:hypothetical protein